MSYWTSILPFLIIIPIAVWTKQVLPGLVVGLLVASYIKEPSLIGGMETMTSYLTANLAQEPKIQVIGFLYIFTGIVNMIEKTGGIKGFIEIAADKVKTQKQAILLIWITLIGTFVSPSLRIVTIAPIMKAMRERLNLTKARVSFVIEASSLPVIALIPIATAFVGFMTSTIDISIKDIAPGEDPYLYFLKSIPYNFFAFVTIILAVVYSIVNHPKLALYGESVPTTNPVEKDGDKENRLDETVKGRPANLIIPLALALTLSIFLSWWDGYQQTKQFWQAFIAADATKAMFVAIIITLLLTFIQFMLQKWPLPKLLAYFFEGGNNLMSAFILFALVWGLSAATSDLGLSTFITFSMGWIPDVLIPPITFILGSLLAYFVGSTWGSWGLIMPIGLSLADVSGNSLPLMIGIVFASGTFGGLISPLSGTTITIAKIMDLDMMGYSKYKLKHTLIPFILTTVLYGVFTFLF
ncbi:Na+/H+ antiporter NhaC family protein [Aquibacillus salsiterrae]|uniref:Sodium:proton antiporter n=1 Tax=Aquibacillus salsiterrae TaxID=2950439 RepID=A0A9X3WF64_9BACI|nr:Na+/H+ antiporter NhaC family protein [Aquibacillus salsiterrae]MDC3417558.1 sodium:proton antiporter [Aquibacillus salsiterrae]